MITRAWVAADIVRIEDGKLAEHWDILSEREFVATYIERRYNGPGARRCC